MGKASEKPIFIVLVNFEYEGAIYLGWTRTLKAARAIVTHQARHHYNIRPRREYKSGASRIREWWGGSFEIICDAGSSTCNAGCEKEDAT